MRRLYDVRLSILVIIIALLVYAVKQYIHTVVPNERKSGAEFLVCPSAKCCHGEF
jgi:hypothetical protein